MILINLNFGMVVKYIPGKDGLDKAQPLFTFPNKTGTVTASYIPALEEIFNGY